MAIRSTKQSEYPVGVCTLPKHLDEQVAGLRPDSLGVKPTTLRAEQAVFSRSISRIYETTSIRPI